MKNLAEFDKLPNEAFGDGEVRLQIRAYIENIEYVLERVARDKEDVLRHCVKLSAENSKLRLVLKNIEQKQKNIEQKRMYRG